MLVDFVLSGLGGEPLMNHFGDEDLEIVGKAANSSAMAEPIDHVARGWPP